MRAEKNEQNRAGTNQLPHAATGMQGTGQQESKTTGQQDKTAGQQDCQAVHQAEAARGHVNRDLVYRKWEWWIVLANSFLSWY